VAISTGGQLIHKDRWLQPLEGRLQSIRLNVRPPGVAAEEEPFDAEYFRGKSPKDWKLIDAANLLGLGLFREPEFRTALLDLAQRQKASCPVWLLANLAPFEDDVFNAVVRSRLQPGELLPLELKWLSENDPKHAAVYLETRPKQSGAYREYLLPEQARDAAGSIRSGKALPTPDAHKDF
jgi:hypothetical protein